MYRKSPAPSDERPRLRYQTPLPSPPRHLYRAAPSFPNPQASSFISSPFPLPLKIYPPNPPKITVLLPPMPKRTEAPRPNGGKKFRLIADVMRSSKPSDDVTENYYADVRCQQCRSGDQDGEMLLCDRCDLGYHLSCLRPIVVRVPSGPWFCPSCDVDRPLRRFPMMQTKIVDFFRIQKCADGKCGPSFSSDGKKHRRHSLTMSKRRRRILPYTPTSDPLRRLEQMSSLATALTTLNMEFSNDLTYMTGMAPKSANQAKLEKGGMQALAKEDKKALQFCRTMYKRGECPPLVVVFDSLEGFTVQAEEHIKDMTFISEYTGDVDYLQKREHDDCDSMMTLLLTGNSSQNLVICPDKRGNIARFINGINNHSLEGRKKQNLKCVRYNVDGECRVLLITCRDISPGERLYYDYNGYEQEYPTEHFV